MKWVALFICSLSMVFASEALQTNHFSDVFKRIDSENAKYGRSKVLVVLDIDNTLLQMTSDLGSDQWFSWQEEVMRQSDCTPLCVSQDYNKLIEYQGLLFAVGNMAATETRLADRIRSMQSTGQKVILLTSRGHDFRSVTEKALAQNGFDFRSSQMGASLAETYLPYDLAQVGLYGITAEEAQLSRLTAARPVSYQNGIYMTAGQNKGIMLKTLLHKYRARFESIVFVDDHQRHVDRMQAILGDELDVTTFRYGGVDERVTRFKQSDKATVTADWQKLKQVVKEIGYGI